MYRPFHLLASPKHFYALSDRLVPILWILACTLLGYGLVAGLLFAPADYQQGDAYRIIYIHVPCAALSLAVFVMMAVAAAIYLIWRIKLADVVAKVSAPLGAWFTFLALLTGSLWGKPMWGTWWIWDARLTSELILLFLYLAVITLRSAIPNTDSSSRITSIFILVGVVDIPIIHYSVNWWNTLHQKSAILQFAKPTLAPSMLYPLIATLLGFFCYYFAVLCMRVSKELLQREAHATWVQQLLAEKKRS
jgi:heme exporter protein C